jgi:cytochrome c2
MDAAIGIARVPRHLTFEQGNGRMRVIMAMFVSTVTAAPAIAAGSATDGQHDFSRCAACHSVQPGKDGIGPSLTGVAGRQSGTEPGYHYSPAMTAAHVTWNDASLDRFLSNPQGLVHGTKMFVSVPDAHQRRTSSPISTHSSRPGSFFNA